MTVHTGNVVPEITAVEHDPILFAKRVSLVSTSTIYAVVNTAAAGQASVSLDASSAWIGLATVVSGATVYAVVNTAAAGQASVVLDTGTSFIGLASVQGNVNATQAGTWNVGTVATITNVVHVDDNAATLSIDDGDGSITIDGSVTADLGANNDVVLNAGINQIGSVTISNMQPLVAGTATVGIMRIAEFAKTLKQLPIIDTTSGPATIFVPTGTFKLVHLLLNSDATVSFNLMSGATYMTGNASQYIRLLPGGGMVENGSKVEPIYTGLAADASFVIDKNSTNLLTGKVVYYEE